MDTEEMYRRGVADAEHGEPHPFYYQHYYQYRRGYDQARRSRGLAGGYYDQRRRRIVRLSALGVALLLGLAGYWIWRGRAAPAVTLAPAEPAPAVAALAPSPTRTPIFATATPPATPTPAGLHVGQAARVSNIGSATLRSRAEPRLGAPTTATFREGDRVTILAGPVEADGFVWWRIEGASGDGWSAQQSPEGVAWLEPAAP